MKAGIQVESRHPAEDTFVEKRGIYWTPAEAKKSAPDIQSHTALRGVAALLVVAYHFRGTLSPLIDVDRYTHFFAKGYLWVDLFFILSGYILRHVYALGAGIAWGAAGNFLRARFARIYPLHIATLLFLATLKVLLPRFTHHPLEVGVWPTFWLNAANLHAWGFLGAYDWNFPSWSISAEFAAYLVFVPLCAGLRRAPNWIYAIVATLILTRLTFVLMMDDRAGWERLALFQCLPMFLLGVILYQSRIITQRTTPKVLSVLQYTAVILIIFSLHLGWNDAFVIGPFTLLVFATQTDAGILARFLTARASVTLGKWSYSIYMLHIPVFLALAIGWPKLIGIPLGLTNKLSAALLFATAIIVTIVGGALSYKFLETPARQYLRR